MARPLGHGGGDDHRDTPEVPALPAVEPDPPAQPAATFDEPVSLAAVAPSALVATGRAVATLPADELADGDRELPG